MSKRSLTYTNDNVSKSDLLSGTTVVWDYLSSIPVEVGVGESCMGSSIDSPLSATVWLCETMGMSLQQQTI